MSNDLSLTPKTGLLALINQNTSVPVTEADLSEIYPPEAIDGATAGQPNTRVIAKTTLEFTHAGRVTLQYKRINLADFTPYNMTATVNDNATLDEFLSMLTTRYGIFFNASDMDPSVPFDVSGGELEYTITLTAKPNSYMYVGSGQVKAKVIWRFDDPEWIEQNINRLRVLLQSDLPLSIISFLNA